MFGLSATTVGLIAAGVSAVGTAASLYESRQSQIAQGHAAQAAQQAAKKNAMLSDEANNQANAKSPDTSAILAANLAAGKQGAAGTMLTGPGGIDPTQLTLGRSSLLGS